MSIIQLIALIAASAVQTPPSQTGPAIVFVCEHGAAKSVIATAYFNKLAAERGLPFRATFRGTSPQDNLSVRAVEGLKADGIAVPAGKPTSIREADITAATYIFAIGCTLPDAARRSGKAGDWSDVPDDQGYGPMRDAIVRHVERLLADLSGASAPRTKTVTVAFDKSDLDRPPRGWLATQTGTGQAKWTVVRDDSAAGGPYVLKQSGQAAYPVCLKEDASLRDGFVEVKFKPVSGSQDQAGGVVWRAKDANNYYITRANALENNVTIYHVINGRRTEKKRTAMTVTANHWHTLRVDFAGSHFTVTFNGQKAIEWDDDTFKDAGKVGVWTKADSVTEFTQFAYGTA